MTKVRGGAPLSGHDDGCRIGPRQSGAARDMTEPDVAHLRALDDASRAMRGLLGVIIAVERRFGSQQSPLALLRQIMDDPQWQWLRPLYQLIADIDHAAHETDLPASEVAAIGGHALALLSGIGAPIEQAFLDRYRALLQTDPEVAIAHSAALQAVRKLPPEADSEAERLHARHQWAMRCKHRRQGQQI